MRRGAGGRRRLESLYNWSRSVSRTLSLSALVLVAACATTNSTPPSSAPSPSPAADGSGFVYAGDFAGPLGVQLYSFRDAFKTDVPGTLARVRALGFREVELAGTYGLSAPAFRQLLNQAGLRATSMHAGYERLRDSMPAVIAEAEALGPRYVGTAWVPHPDGPMTAALARQTAVDFNRWGQMARARGLTFFYHVHGYEFLPDADGVRPIDILMRNTDSSAVAFEMDVFWVARPGADPVALLRQYPGRWALMHIKDMRPGTPTDVHTGGADPNATEVPVGSGQIDYRAVLRAAREAGLARYYLEDETAAPFTTVPQSTRWLEGVRY